MYELLYVAPVTWYLWLSRCVIIRLFVAKVSSRETWETSNVIYTCVFKSAVCFYVEFVVYNNILFNFLCELFALRPIIPIRKSLNRSYAHIFNRVIIEYVYFIYSLLFFNTALKLFCWSTCLLLKKRPVIYEQYIDVRTMRRSCLYFIFSVLLGHGA